MTISEPSFVVYPCTCCHMRNQSVQNWRSLYENLFPSSQANELLQSSRQIQNKLEKDRTLKESLRLYQQISHHTDLPLICSQYRQGERLSGSALNSEELNDLYITNWSSSAPVQCVSMRAWWSCVSQPLIRKTLRNWGRTSTGTENRRRTPLASRRFRRGQYTRILIIKDPKVLMWELQVRIWL